MESKVHLFQKTDGLEGALDKRPRGRSPMTGGDLLVEGAGIDSYPDHLPVRPGHRARSPGCLRCDILPGLIRIPSAPCLHRQEGKSMLEMDVGDQGDMNPVLDLPDGRCCRFIGNRNTDDFTARLFQFADLFDRGVDVARIGGGHGLDNDRRIAADLHPSQGDGSCFLSSNGRIQTGTLSLGSTYAGFPAPYDSNARNIKR